MLLKRKSPADEARSSLNNCIAKRIGYMRVERVHAALLADESARLTGLAFGIKDYNASTVGMAGTVTDKSQCTVVYKLGTSPDKDWWYLCAANGKMYKRVTMIKSDDTWVPAWHSAELFTLDEWEVRYGRVDR